MPVAQRICPAQAHQALPGAPPLPQSTPLPATSLPRPPPYRSPLTQQSMVRSPLRWQAGTSELHTKVLCMLGMSIRP